MNSYERAKVLMMMLALNESIDQLAMANCVHWYGDLLRRDDGHFLRSACDFEAENQI